VSLSATWLSVQIVTALVGGFLGGWLVAYKLGAWRKAIEKDIALVRQEAASGFALASKSRKTIHEQVDEIKSRLERGDSLLGKVPVLATEIKHAADELRATSRILEQFRAEFVTRRDCDLRHSPKGA